MISTISISQPRSSKSLGKHDGRGSPGIGRSTSPGGLHRFLSSESEDYFRCTGSRSDNDIRSEAYSVGNGIKYLAGTCNDMALNAVMMSGGGLHMKHGSSVGNLTQVGENSWGNEDDRSPNSSKCSCDKNKETVIINVGGQIFETYKSTLKKLKSCKLANEKEMLKYYREDKGDYFFDRDPYAFNIILNYLRYGDLHLPTHLCGPTLMREFKFWGVDEQNIERCCFQPYNTWKTQTRSLEKLEYDRKQSTTQTDLAKDRKSHVFWRRVRAIVWTFLQDPTSSPAAKVYAWICIMFVLLSIFSFCAETHPYFQLPPSEVHNFRAIYSIFALEDSTTIRESASKNSPPEVRTNNTSLNVTSVNVTASAVNQNTTEPEGEELTVQHPVLLIIDLLCVFFFSSEFLTRLAFSPKKLRFCTSLQNIIDVVAILPDYVEFILLTISPSVRQGLSFMDFIFILRILRLCRLFRLIRHVPGLWILLYTLKASFNELLLMFVFLLIGMVMFASLLHFAEGEKDFSNIPVGFWWSVVTMTTVGYGDMYPVTGFGYIIGSICAISGLLMIAFTVPIIVSNFVLYYTHVQYGISEKENPAKRLPELNEEMETCSLHTSYTDTNDGNRCPTVSRDSGRGDNCGSISSELSTVDRSSQKL